MKRPQFRMPRPGPILLRSPLLGDERSFRLALLGAAVLGLSLPLILLARDDHAQGQSLAAAVAEQRQQIGRAQHKLAGLRQEAQTLQARMDALSPARTGAVDVLRPHSLALQQRLRLEQLKTGVLDALPAGATAMVSTGPKIWTLRVRGSHRALVGYLDSLARTGPAWRLRQLQGSAGKAQMHSLELQIEALSPSQWLPPSMPEPLNWSGTGDPLGLPADRLPTRLVVAAPVKSAPTESLPVDPLANMPPAWRAEWDRTRGPLELLPLKDLTLSGTLRQGAVWMALVRSGAVIHSLAVGDYIGPDLGRVQRVDEAGLELREIRLNPQGQWVEQLRRWPVGGTP